MTAPPDRRPQAVVPLGGEDRPVALWVGEIRELQRLTGVGPYRMMARLRSSDAVVDDVISVIRLGLEGGGARPDDAVALVTRYIVERGDWLRGLGLAQVIMAAAVSGPEDLVPGKEEAAEETTSPSPQPTAQEPRSGSRRRRSTE